MQKILINQNWMDCSINLWRLQFKRMPKKVIELLVKWQITKLPDDKRWAPYYTSLHGKIFNMNI